MIELGRSRVQEHIIAFDCVVVVSFVRGYLVTNLVANEWRRQ